MRRGAGALALATVAAVGAVACGGSPSAGEARARVEGLCAAAAPGLRPRVAPPGAGRMGHLTEVLSTYNSLDAGLDAVEGPDDVRGRVAGMRAALARVRTAFVSQYGISTRPPGEARARPADAAPAFAALDRAAAAVGTPACASSRLGRPLYDRYSRTMVEEAAVATPTGDFAADITAACRALPRSLALPPRPVSDPGRAQAWALTVRSSLTSFSQVLAGTPGPPAARAAAGRARAVIAQDHDVISGYTEAARTESFEETARTAALHARLVARMRATLEGVGVNCTP